jgi:hypothetical protein
MPRSAGHVFYEKLNALLAEGEFDRWLESRCEAYYAKGGRPSIPPGVYFRMLLVGYFEGLGSQRGIAWRCADSLSLSGIGFVPATHDRVIPAIERGDSCGFTSAKTLKGAPWQENSQWQNELRSKHFTNPDIRTAK